jgi:APA family basic amino acid/polyamine antiporter
MMFRNLFRKKNVQDILNQVESNEHGHQSLGRHLTVRDLAAFGIAAIIGAGIFSTIGKASADGGPLPVALLHLPMPNLHLWCRFQAARIHTPMLLLVS